MNLLILCVLLVAIELLYFSLAKKFNIVDIPNTRSSHANVTIRGGGIIFFFSILFFFISSGGTYIYFFIGLFFMTLISFLDDIFDLPNRTRLIIHFGSVMLLAMELNMFSLPWYYLILMFTIVVGVINAYNFMDGINGITTSYSLSVIILLMITNADVKFVEQALLSYTLVSVLIFGFFNFRLNAKAFAGDVGSVSIAYILLFCLGSLIIASENFIYILFLAVYGVDTVWTIIARVLKRENIFTAHRTHLYQYLVNEARCNKLIIASMYGFVQLSLGVLVIYLTRYNFLVQVSFSLCILLILSISYLLVKRYVVSRYVLS
ncbi:UDP-GlcNAc--UDP-phosphate GlcNAc-1-phosphate transferase [Sphingobacterium humi]|uniref:UDP-GlcNAc--UDP-phosphate GlcNAc-1-phosphate transferase n=1 Tax=Sphingobacterium humi TaxID=1796905 RepID=A0A6N8L5D2_9SPHI|nr:UDP-GlcNAc--UDP-phosphate GlcNAc-1-phosphate transferase [Sphingobacterium humi]MVZ63651.1 UDP-GlcNAc--UDP-phosphate GlcNAc-1-phosphate transferase [Sphingobacterium humi]